MNLDIRTIQQFPMLSPSDEKSMWKEYFDERTSESKKRQIQNKMITSHLRIGMAIARKWVRPGILLDDLFGAAQEGLVVAFEKFSPEKETRFSTYAAWWIKAKVQSYVIENSSSIKTGTTAFQKYLFFNYPKLEEKARNTNPDFNDRQLEEYIAQQCIDSKRCQYTSVDKVIDEIKAYKLGRYAEVSLHSPIGNSEDSSSLIDFIEDDNVIPVEDRIVVDQESHLRLEFLEAAGLKMISIGQNREWEILKARRLVEVPATLEELSGTYGVSRERIRQIELRAFQRLQKMILSPMSYGLNPEDSNKKNSNRKKKDRDTSKVGVLSEYKKPLVPLKSNMDEKDTIKEEKDSASKQRISKDRDSVTSSEVNKGLLKEILESSERTTIALTRRGTTVGYFVRNDLVDSPTSFKDSLTLSEFRANLTKTLKGPANIKLSVRKFNFGYSYVSNEEFLARKLDVPANLVTDFNSTAEDYSVPITDVVDFDEVTFSEDEYDRPEVNPDPYLLDVPYIAISDSLPWFSKALKDFNEGIRDGFQKASIVKAGAEYPNEGRWVYVGLKM